jgi:hypothetical protein
MNHKLARTPHYETNPLNFKANKYRAPQSSYYTQSIKNNTKQISTTEL